MSDIIKRKHRKYNLDDKENVKFILSILFLFSLLVTTTVYLMIDSYVEKIKNEVQTAPLFSQSISDEFQDSELFTSDNAYVAENSSDFLLTPASYDNQNLLSCTLRNGETFTVGEGNIERGDALVINPHIKSSSGCSERSYLVYAICNTGGLIYPDELQRKDKLPGKTYLLTGRTYEHIAPANELMWKHDYVAENCSFANTLFQFRIIDVNTLSMIGTASCGVDWDGKTFKLVNLKSTDLIERNDINESDKEIIIESATKYITDPASGILRTFIKEADIDTMRDNAVAEQLVRPYFDILLDRDGKYIYSDKIPFIHPYAVTFKTKIGPVTIYVGEEQEINGNLHMETEDQTFTNISHSKYIAFGYDFLYPVSDDELIILPTAKDIIQELQLDSF